jgi:hypothetical protein
MNKIISVFLISILANAAFASSVGLSTTKSSSSSSTTLSGSYGKSIEDSVWAWEAFLDATSSTWDSTDSTTGEISTGKSTARSLGATFDNGPFSVAPGLTFTEDITNKVSGTELNGSVAYKFKLEKLNLNKDDGFIPWLKLSGKFGRNVLKQTDAPRNAKGLSLVQTWAQTTVTLKMIKMLSVFAKYKKYSYSEDPSTVQTQISNAPRRSGNSGPGNANSQTASPPQPGFSDTMSSLLYSVSTVGLSFYPNEEWEISAYRASSVNAVDDSTSIDSNLGVYWIPDDRWTVGINVGQSKSDSSTSSYSGASVEYEF